MLYAGRACVTGNGRGQALLGGKGRLATGHGLFVVRIGDMSADVIALSFRHARCVDGDRLSLTFHFAAIGGPINIHRVLRIEIVRRDRGFHRLTRPDF